MSAPAPLGVKALFKEVLSTKSGKLSLIILIAIASLAIMVPIYAGPEVIRRWNNPRAWENQPTCAAPEWVDFFLGIRSCRNTYIGSEEFFKYNKTIGGGVYKLIVLRTDISYDYDTFPNIWDGFRLSITINTTQNMFVEIRWVRPDERVVVLWSDVVYSSAPLTFLATHPDIRAATSAFIYNTTGVYVEPDKTFPQIALFAKAGPNMNDPDKAEVLKGKYRLVISAVVYGEGDVNASFLIYGRVFGLAGTDNLRRDIMIGILWGAPIALAFGLSASLILSFVHAFFGITAGWFGGRVDEFIQRLTEVFMIIPVLPILILISYIWTTIYLKTMPIWMVIVILIALSPVGGGTLTVRSLTLQIKEEQYILATIAYGAGSRRIIFRHIFPRVTPYMIVGIVSAVPSYIFLEAALSILGLGDPTLPTWGKILSDAYNAKALYIGWWLWILVPTFFIAVTAFAFALLGYALDKIVNPRLREM